MATDTKTRRSELPVLAPAGHVDRPAVPLRPDAPRVSLVTLGCDKNTVDSERLMARLSGAGARVLTDVADADVLLINTCGFIDVAKEESVDAILHAIRLKQDGRVRAVVAMGCMVQRYRSELEHELPEVDLFLGLTEAERLIPELRSRGLLDGEARVPTMELPLRLLSTSRRHTSHLKISEGCDHTCAFCAIPLMRGRHRSTPIDVLVREAQQLEAAGVVELNLVSQDTTWYGRDIARGIAPSGTDWFVGRPFAGMRGTAAAAFETAQPSRSAVAERDGAQRHGLLPDLLAALLEGTSIPWLRLFYMYPSGIRRELVDMIAAQPRIVPYLDMPIQHGSDSVLKRMRRPERRSTIRERVAWLRDAIPDVALRTTVIVGFPGETEEEFEEMLELLEEIRFDHLGAFAYSEEEDTPAASMAGQVDAGSRRERLERVLDLQRAIAQERSEQWLGRTVRVLIDEPTGRRGAVGRTARQAPEIDGAVHIEDACGAKPGDFVDVRITDVIEADWKGERVTDAGHED